MTISVGDKIPSVALAVASAEGPQPQSTDDLFNGKKVALFSVPGAFTPTCSARHLPGFIEQHDALKSKGIDLIVCVSVNDGFVMDAWGAEHGTGEKVTMLADGNGDFAKSVGLEMDGRGFGMGIRSQRFSMVVNDGTVEILNIEEPGAFEVSSAEHMLSQL